MGSGGTAAASLPIVGEAFPAELADCGEDLLNICDWRCAVNAHLRISRLSVGGLDRRLHTAGGV